MFYQKRTSIMDINDLLYPADPSLDVTAGDLILAEPMMEEAYFARSAILLLDSPDSGGHLGLVMNKKTNLTLKDLMPDLEGAEKIEIYCGGPVEMERMFMIHKLPHVFSNSFETKQGLFVGADLDELADYISNGGEIEGKLRLFLGYSGWSKGQLEGEINRNSWAVNRERDSKELLNGDGLEYWQREVRMLGERYRSWLMVPPDPSFN